MKNLISPQLLVEFQAKPVPMAKIVDFLDSNSDVTAAALCKQVNIPPQSVYNWRQEQRKKAGTPLEMGESSEFKVVPIGVNGRYSATDKLSLLKQYEKIESSGQPEFLRTYGLYQSDIKRWREVMEAAAIESLGKRKTRSDKKPSEEKIIEALKKELLARDKKIEKLETLVMIQKKLSVLLSENESV